MINRYLFNSAPIKGEFILFFKFVEVDYNLGSKENLKKQIK